MINILLIVFAIIGIALYIDWCPEDDLSDKIYDSVSDFFKKK